MHVQDTFKRPLQDLRISVTDRCNFRCNYCMPAEIFGEAYQFMPHPALLTFEEITRLARLMIGLGVRKLRLTGGEPLLRREVYKLVGMLAGLGADDLAMTTNGFLLEKWAPLLAENGLKRVTVSLDSLDNEVFRRMNGDKADVAPVLAGIRAAERVGLTPIKVNAVVQKGVNDHTLVDLARFCKDSGYTLRFIEYMDVGTRNGWQMDQVVPAEEILARIDAALPIERVAPDYFGEVAYRYRYRDGGGEVGVIASVTKPFCGTCTRLRLSPEGQIYTCLFARAGVSLRDPLRAGATDDELINLVTGIWRKRTDRYSEIRTAATDPDEAAAPDDGQPRKKIEMYYIGG